MIRYDFDREDSLMFDSFHRVIAHFRRFHRAYHHRCIVRRYR
jgi:hypothetical protein